MFFTSLNAVGMNGVFPIDGVELWLLIAVRHAQCVVD